MLRSSFFWVVTVPSTTFFSLVSIVGGLVHAPAGLHDWVHRNWSRSLLWAAGVRVAVYGRDNVRRDGPQIFVSNHQSFFDIFAMLACLPVSIRFVAKKELGRIPVLAQAMRAAGHVLIDRQDRRGASRAMRKAGERMERENLSLGLFPEGTRSRDGQLREFKKGTFVLAIETQVPIVPVAVEGGYRVISGGCVRRGNMNLRVAAALPTEGRTAADRDEVLSAVRGTIREMLATPGGATADRG
jgi:1-acyl-sn-glycerol-3-phosphate acyltransferase